MEVGESSWIFPALCLLSGFPLNLFGEEQNPRMLRFFGNLSEYQSELLRRSGFIGSGTPCSPPSRRRGGGISVQASGGVDSSPKWLLHSETHGSSSSSSHPAAALFHKLRLVPLLPGGGGILGLSRELIRVKIIGLESLAAGFHIEGSSPFQSFELKWGTYFPSINIFLYFLPSKNKN